MKYNYKIKLIVGFRRDQEHTIDANEAHKAYYLFLNPEARGIFSNGLAIKGSEISEIVPDWQGTMGWNKTHTLDGYDWNEIRRFGVDRNLNALITAAKDVAARKDTRDLEIPLVKLIMEKYPQLKPAPETKRTGGLKSLKELIHGTSSAV